MATSAGAEPTVLVIEGGERRGTTAAARDLWQSRSLIATFAARAIRVRYTQTAFGIAWACLPPLLFLLIFGVTVGHFAGVSGGGVPYSAFALSALVPWTSFQSSVAFASGVLVDDAALLQKVYFPREVPLFGALMSSGVDYSIGLVLLTVLTPVLGGHVSVTWLWVVPLTCILAILAAGAALALAPLNVQFRDVRYALPVLLQAWFFASPVVYPLTVIPHAWRKLYCVANPAVGVLDGFRRALALGQTPDLRLLGISTLSSTALLWLGFRLFKRLEPGFADVL